MKDTPPNEFRYRNAGPWSTSDADGMNGAFAIPLKGRGHKVFANCIVSDGKDAPDEFGGWEHVSVHIMEFGKQRIPTWEEMCVVKDLFWNQEEAVVQFHPPKSEYVNNHPCVLHLWKWTKGEFPRPDSMLVGIKGAVPA